MPGPQEHRRAQAQPDAVNRQALNIDTVAEPVVSTVPRAATMLGVQPDRLHEAVTRAELEPWARHADGSDCFRWPELVAAVRDHLGVAVPRTRPTLAEWAERREQRQRRKQAGGQARTQERRSR